MTPLEQLYATLAEWIGAAEENDNARCAELRAEFGELEKEAFGSIAEHVKNPLAMKYDLVRNILMRYLENKDSTEIEAVKDIFEQIPEP